MDKFTRSKFTYQIIDDQDIDEDKDFFLMQGKPIPDTHEDVDMESD